MIIQRIDVVRLCEAGRSVRPCPKFIAGLIIAEAQDVAKFMDQGRLTNRSALVIDDGIVLWIGIDIIVVITLEIRSGKRLRDKLRVIDRERVPCMYSDAGQELRHSRYLEAHRSRPELLEPAQYASRHPPRRLSWLRRRLHSG